MFLRNEKSKPKKVNFMGVAQRVLPTLEDKGWNKIDGTAASYERHNLVKLPHGKNISREAWDTRLQDLDGKRYGTDTPDWGNPDEVHAWNKRRGLFVDTIGKREVGAYERNEATIRDRSVTTVGGWYKDVQRKKKSSLLDKAKGYLGKNILNPLDIIDPRLDAKKNELQAGLGNFGKQTPR